LTNLADIAKDLRRYSGKLAVDDPTVKALTLVDAIPEGYVWPDVEWEDDSEDSAGILLITAAGAVGKSAAAEALAGTLNWPLIDAGRAQVGSFSVTGLIYDALGLNSIYIRDLGNGESGVIIDALDEAHLKAGTSNFYEFLENIRRITRRNSGKPIVILLSRPDTAVLVKLFLESNETAFASGRLKFFDHNRSCQYIESQLRQLHRKHPDKNYGVAQRYPGPFAELRDMRMREVAGALLSREVEDLESTWPEVHEFLGYAPVLSVLAEFLAVPNPHAETSKNLAEAGGARNVLIRIINDIMEREQDKFRTQVIAKLQAQVTYDEEWRNPAECYTPHEQSLRLVAKFFEQELAVEIPASLPASIRPAYENDASQFLADHPFVSGTEAINVVFSDYVIATALVDPVCSVSFRSDLPNDENLNTGPFFYQFAHQLAPKGREGVPAISEAVIAKIFTSHRKAQVDPTKAFFIYSQMNDDVFMLLSGELGLKGDPLEFEVVESSGIIEFSTQLSRGHVVSDGGVVLGEHGKRFLIGPGVIIQAADIEIHADILTVDDKEGNSKRTPCVIMADNVKVSGNLKVETQNENSLGIIGKCNWPALRRYAVEMQDLPRVPRADYVHLRAILKAFRQGAGHAPSVFEELMDQRIIKDNETRRYLLGKLISRGFVSKQSRHYYLDTTRLAKEGIDWGSFIGGSPSSKILEFLVELAND
jgi:hypothetical protein